MKRIFERAMVAILVLGTVFLTACSDEDNGDKQADSSGVSTSLLVATDRHEAGEGNNLAVAVQMAVSRFDAVTPSVVLLGGDYVGRGPDRGETGQPAFTLADLRKEIYRTLSPVATDVLFTYGSHDQACVDGYQAFFSGPRRCNGYYVYGISYAQMVFDTDSLTRVAVALYEEQENAEGEGGADSMPENEESKETPSEPAGGEGGGGNPSGLPPEPKGGVRAYNGIDVVDPFGISAESATARFTSWVSTLTDNAPIVVMSHVPMHAHRNDNPGGASWFDALSRAAEKHDIIFFFGHNHSLEERGDSLDQYCYLLTAGDSIDIQGNGVQGVERKKLNFTYANAGYLKLGRCTLVTFSDTDGDGCHDKAELRRFNVLGDVDSRFGMTDKRNPYTLKLQSR